MHWRIASVIDNFLRTSEVLVVSLTGHCYALSIVTDIFVTIGM